MVEFLDKEVAFSLLGEDLAAWADGERTAGEGLFDAEAGDGPAVVAGQAEDSVFLAAGAKGGAGPDGPALGGDRSGVGGKREEHEFDVLDREEPGGFRDQRVEADVDAEAAEGVSTTVGPGPPL